MTNDELIAAYALIAKQRGGTENDYALQINSDGVITLNQVWIDDAIVPHWFNMGNVPTLAELEAVINTEDDFTVSYAAKNLLVESSVQTSCKVQIVMPDYPTYENVFALTQNKASIYVSVPVGSTIKVTGAAAPYPEETIQL